MLNSSRTALVGIALAMVVGAAALVFWPALDGPFVFDDFHNLKPLANNGGVTGFQKLVNFVFSGEAGALGRPLSLVTFLINDFTWPSDPWSFKYTNLLIHLINGLLVFVLARQLTRLASTSETTIFATAVAATALWLLHPMHLSTMMPVVQRMTELAATWTLAGVITYLYGRRLAMTHRSAGYFLMSVGVGLGGILATLSKENGVLLPLYLLVIETTLLTNHRSPPGSQVLWRAWRAMFLCLPLMLLAGHFVLSWDSVSAGYGKRGFTLTERLLTEPRILFDYLHHILLPRVGGSGLFHDDYPISRGLFSPWSTLFALVGVIGLVTAAIRVRTRAPMLAFSVLWFFAGHALESSFIALELYFEHRNYLPMLGPLYAVSFYAMTSSRKLYRALSVATTAFAVLLATLSWQSSLIWGNARLLANVWAKENPTSVRAQQYAAKYWFDHGRLDQSQQSLQTAALHHPDNATIQLQLLIMDCLGHRRIAPRLEAVLRAARSDIYQTAISDSLNVLRGYVKNKRCPALSFDDLLAVDAAFFDNPHYAAPKHNAEILYERAKVYIAQRKLTHAMATLDRVYQLHPIVDVPLLQARLLLTASLPKRALQYVELAKGSEHRGHYPLVSRAQDIAALEADAKSMLTQKPQPTPASF